MLIASCDETNTPTDAVEIREAESHLRIRLPNDLKEYLIRQNGGFFRSLRILTPFDPVEGDRLESLFGINPKFSGKSTYDCDEHDDDLLDWIGDPGNLMLFENNNPIVVLPIGRTLLGHLVVIRYKDGSPIGYEIKMARNPIGFAEIAEDFSGLMSLCTLIQ
jgi:hypothetical protein